MEACVKAELNVEVRNLCFAQKSFYPENTNSLLKIVSTGQDT